MIISCISAMSLHTIHLGLEGGRYFYLLLKLNIFVRKKGAERSKL